MALNGLFCADVPLRNYSLTHSLTATICTLDKTTANKYGTPVSPPRSWGPLSPSGMKFCHEVLETLNYRMLKTRSLISTRLETVLGCDGRTDRWTKLP